MRKYNRLKSCNFIYSGQGGLTFEQRPSGGKGVSPMDI